MPPAYGRPLAPRAAASTDPGCRAAAAQGMVGHEPPLPLPVRIAAGLVATAVEQARDLPRLALELPVTAVSQALQASMRVQQKVTELAIKGDQVLGVRPPSRRSRPGRRSTRTSRRRATAASTVTEPRPAATATVPGARRRRRRSCERERRPPPIRRSRAGRSRGARRDASRRPSSPTHRRRPARLRRADDPAAARQAAPSRRRRPARAAGLGAGHGDRPPFVTMLSNRITTVTEG